MAFPVRDVAKASGAVNVATTSTLVAANNPSRQEITIVNDHATQVVYLAFATTPGVTPTAVASSGIRLNAAGGSYTTTSYTGAISGISVGGTSPVTVAEF